MKLSKRGLRGILFSYGMMSIGIGLYFFTEAVPEKIWVPIFFFGGLILVTIGAYKLGAPSSSLEGSWIEISLKRLFRRGPVQPGK